MRHPRRKVRQCSEESTIGRAARSVADAVASIIDDPPAGADPEGLRALAARGRGLLAHGTGRLAIHTLGRRLGVTDDDDPLDVLRARLGVER